MGQLKDLVGKKFGRLTVIKLEGSQDKSRIWLCVCDCGKESSIPTISLTSGNTKSCGCFQKDRMREALFEDLTGQKFGKLLILEQDKTKEKYSAWICQCDCGNTTSIRAQSLKSENSKSCGCGHKEAMKKNVKSDTSLKKLYKQYLNKAQSKQRKFLLSQEYFKELTSTRCYYCNREPLQICKSRSGSIPYLYNGIDRKDNNEGYIIENCVPCCKYCNYAKRHLSLEEFKSWIQLVYNNLFKENTDVE